MKLFMYRAKRDIAIRLTTIFEGQTFALPGPEMLQMPAYEKNWLECYEQMSVELTETKLVEPFEAT